MVHLFLQDNCSPVLSLELLWTPSVSKIINRTTIIAAFFVRNFMSVFQIFFYPWVYRDHILLIVLSQVSIVDLYSFLALKNTWSSMRKLFRNFSHTKTKFKPNRLFKFFLTNKTYVFFNKASLKILNRVSETLSKKCGNRLFFFKTLTKFQLINSKWTLKVTNKQVI